MPVVKSEIAYIDGKNFTRKVKCNASGWFTCALPDYVNEALGLNKVTEYKDMGECLVGWRELVKKYENRTVSTNRVICFEFEKEVSFGKGQSLTLAVMVCEETATTHRDGSIVYKYQGVRSNLPHSIQHRFDPNARGDRHEAQIPWTEKSENFFVDLSNAMSVLIGKLDDMSSSTEAMLTLISSGARLLGPPSKNEQL